MQVLDSLTRNTDSKTFRPPKTMMAQVAGRAALLVVSCVAAVLALEVAVRWTGIAAGSITDPIFQRSRYAGVVYEFKPNAHGTVWGLTALQTNSHGLRGSEVSLTRPKRTLRIGVFGDSVTFGQGVSDGETYARVLERKLRDRFAAQGYSVEVLNFGVPAYNITNMVSTFTEKGVQFDFDVGILAPILEDYSFERDHTVDEFGYPVNSSTPVNPGFFKNVLRHLHLAYVVRDAYWKYIGAYGPNLNAVTDPYDDSELAKATWQRAGHEISRFSAVAKQHGVVPIYASLGWAISPRLSEITNGLQLPVVEMRTVLEGYDPSVLRVSDRDAHPSALQHALIADALFGPVCSILEQRVDAPPVTGASESLCEGSRTTHE